MHLSFLSTSILYLPFYYIFLKLIIWIRRIYFHPLSKFPGPKIAAATGWWRTYVEVWRGNSWVGVLGGLHGVYGDVVRVGPCELHFRTPKAYHDIYAPTLRWDKEPFLYQSFGEDLSSFGLLKVAHAKQRKDVLAPLFSRGAVDGLQGLIREKVEELITGLKRENAQDRPSNMLYALRSFAIDTITTYSFSHSLSSLSHPHFTAPIVTAMDASLPTFHLFHHFPLFRRLIFSLPPWLANAVAPQMAGLTNLQVILRKEVRDVVRTPGGALEGMERGHETIYKVLVGKLREGNELFNEESLYHEALTLLFAGGATVADTAMTCIYHVLSHPYIHARLLSELKLLPKELPTLRELEGLDYLNAVIKEALRLSPGVCSPLLRVVPGEGAWIDGQRVEGGMVVGISSWFLHRNPTIFPNPQVMDPDRWLVEDGEGKEKLAEMNAAFQPFSRGPRACSGVNLAWAELRMVVAALVGGFPGMEVDGGWREVMEKEGRERDAKERDGKGKRNRGNGNGKDEKRDKKGEGNGDGKVRELWWRDCFTPWYGGQERGLRVWCREKKS